MGLFDGLLDASVYFSFDKTGFARHARRFDPADLPQDLRGRRYAITGGNGGLGLEIGAGLAAQGATVVLLCRDAARAQEACATLKQRTGATEVSWLLCDLGDPTSVDAAAEALSVHPSQPGPAPLHGLIHNAGLLPAERSLTPFGYEQTVAVHLLGPLRLTAGLLPSLRAAASPRIIWVSSGGMYSRRLDLAALASTEGTYDGVRAYALTKRAQVVLAEVLESQLAPAIRVHAMHPGWADTPGVVTSLPRFYRFAKDRLRSPAEGADTAVWLAAAPDAAVGAGRFWFDRAVAKTEVVPCTATRPADRAALLPTLAEWAGLSPEALL
jgi:NAD(P)-dependent dehydrogenase (short-subunit alcohol dehydrogenase family)